MDYRIVRATARDAEGVLRLYRAQLGRAYCFWDEDYPGPDTIEADLAREGLFVMKDASDEIVAAISVEADEAVDRLDLWTPTLQPGGEFARLAVAPGLQNRGLGQRMVAHMLDELKQNGVSWIGLIGAPGTEHFYRELGFEPMAGFTPMRYTGSEKEK